MIFQPQERLHGAAQILSQVCLMVSKYQAAEEAFLAPLASGLLAAWHLQGHFSAKTFKKLMLIPNPMPPHLQFLSLYLSFNARMAGNKRGGVRQRGKK